MNLLPLRPASRLAGNLFINIDHPLSWHSPATAAMIDFLERRPPVLEFDTPAVLAEQLMLQEHSKLKIVIDRGGRFMGLVTLADVCNQRIMQCVVSGMDREDVSVRHLMQPSLSLATLHYEDLQGSSVADVAYTLKTDHVQHCLVIDDSPNQLRGLISVIDLAERLGADFTVHTAPSFATLVRGFAN